MTSLYEVIAGCGCGHGQPHQDQVGRAHHPHPVEVAQTLWGHHDDPENNVVDSSVEGGVEKEVMDKCKSEESLRNWGIRRMSRKKLLRVQHEEAGEEDCCEVPKIAPDTGLEIIPVQAGAVPHVGGQGQGGAPPSCRRCSSRGPV